MNNCSNKQGGSITNGGFTLVETTIVVGIIALVVAITIPVTASLSKAELRMSAGRLSALIRSTYDQAALSGGTTRLVFDMEKNQVKAEFQENRTFLSKRSPQEENLEQKDKENKEQVDPEEDEQDENMAALGQLAATLGIQVPADQTEAMPFEDTGTAMELPESVKIDGFWASHLSEALTQQVAYLYFFPLGYTEHAIIYLADEGGSVYSLEVKPLTGRVVIHNEHIPIPN